MTRREVRFTATVQKHLRLLQQWWWENSMQPEILHHDIGEAIQMLSVLPGVGSPYSAAPIPGVRRLYLERLMSHLYYTSDEQKSSFEPCGMPGAARGQSSAHDNPLSSLPAGGA